VVVFGRPVRGMKEVEALLDLLKHAAVLSLWSLMKLRNCFSSSIDDDDFVRCPVAAAGAP